MSGAMLAALKIFVVALSLALDVFAVAVGVGIRGASPAAQVRIGLAFASAEIIMNLVGAGLGAALGSLLGDVTGYIGFVALVGLGTYMIYESRRDLEERTDFDMSQGWPLLLASLSISLDSLGIGFSILYIGVPVVAALTTIGVVSVVATFSGLRLGRVLGRAVEDRAEFLAGVVLLLTGIAFILAKALHWG